MFKALVINSHIVLRGPRRADAHRRRNTSAKSWCPCLLVILANSIDIRGDGTASAFPSAEWWSGVAQIQFGVRADFGNFVSEIILSGRNSRQGGPRPHKEKLAGLSLTSNELSPPLETCAVICQLRDLRNEAAWPSESNTC